MEYEIFMKYFLEKEEHYLFYLLNIFHIIIINYMYFIYPTLIFNIQ